MRVFVAGATGVVGRRAVARLVGAGNEVTAVARTAAKAALVQQLGAARVELELFDREAVRRVVKGHNAVVNLATKIPPLERAFLPGAWAENDRIRREASRNLVDAALAADVQHYIQESLAFMYADRGDEWIDEDTSMEAPRYARSVVEAERQALRMTEAGRRGIVLRFGQFYAPDATHTLSMVRIARRGLSPFLGPPEAFTPTIHSDDVATAVVAGLEAKAGTYNIVDDEPLRRRQLADALSAALGIPRLRFAPSPLTRLGGEKVRMLMRSLRVSNARFRKATGWSPAFASARHGLPAVVREIEAAAR